MATLAPTGVIRVEEEIALLDQWRRMKEAGVGGARGGPGGGAAASYPGTSSSGSPADGAARDPGAASGSPQVDGVRAGPDYGLSFERVIAERPRG